MYLPLSLSLLRFRALLMESASCHLSISVTFQVRALPARYELHLLENDNSDPQNPAVSIVPPTRFAQVPSRC